MCILYTIYKKVVLLDGLSFDWKAATLMSEAPVFRTIREQVADRIRADGLSGRLSEGTSLREQSLARQYGVSRAPIRDALLQLTQEGLLVAKPNCGVQVASPSGDSNW
jgi:DNA-binding GntR family transcriptional regulator